VVAASAMRREIKAVDKKTHPKMAMIIRKRNLISFQAS
jgi:hypothetical protein